MRIGEILLREGWVYPDELESALADQKVVGRRLCSMLILRGHLEPDQAAKALAEQHGVSAALVKHLEHREKALTKLLPGNIARVHGAIPLGRMRDGEIVICVRDPKPQSQGTFERILNKPVLIVVAAACSIEPLIEQAYPPAVTQDFAMRFARPSTQPATVPNAPPSPMSFAIGTESAANGVVEHEFEVDLDSGPTPVPDHAGELPMPEVFTIVDLDDAGVDKDFSQHDMKTPTTLPPPNVTRTPAKK
jgi:hypothetical protein